MIRVRGIVATTHVDSQGDRFTREALDGMVEQSNRTLIPITLEHDPRLPPVGRLVMAQVVKLSDGETGIEVEGEIFENGDQVSFSSAKQIAPAPHDASLYYDSAYTDPEDKQLVGEIASIMGKPAQEQLKKSVDPISVILISLGVAAFNRFFDNLNDDLYKSFRDRLLRLLDRHRRTREQIVIFELSLPHGATNVDVEILLVDPSEKEIDTLKDLSVTSVREQLTSYLRIVGISKVVMRFDHGVLVPLYGLRADSVPVTADNAVLCHGAAEIPTGFSVLGRKD
jgi:hypothetical protein